MTEVQLLLRLTAGCALAGFCAAVSPASAEDAPATKAVKLPFTVFDEKDSTNNHHVPSGWMANTICGSQRHCIRPWYSAITRRKWYNTKGTNMDEGCATNPHGGATCLRFEYSEPAEWAGVVWQDPAND